MAARGGGSAIFRMDRLGVIVINVPAGETATGIEKGRGNRVRQQFESDGDSWDEAEEQRWERGVGGH